MAFLALASQKSLMTLRKNFLELQQISIQHQVEAAQASAAAIQNSHKGDQNWSSEDDPRYQYYAQLEDTLSTEKDSLESQLTALNNEISSLKTLVNNNIKSSCTLNLASGG